MSFGFGVGDFLDVIELVTRLRKDFADAPSQIRDLSAELKTFSIVLQDTEVDLTVSELDPEQRESLETTVSSARDFFKDLQRFIGNNKEISTATGSKARVKRVWKRLNFDQQEVAKLRLQITSSILGLQAFTSHEVKHSTRKIAQYVDNQVQKDVLQERRDILKWLSDDDFKYHKNIQSHLVRNRQAGTRKWLLESDEWETWLKSGGRTLYCPGIPGSGKTFTTAMVIEKIEGLSQGRDRIYAYVFCSYQQRQENMREMLLRSLLRMILEQTTQTTSEIRDWYAKDKEPSTDEIIEELRVAMLGPSEVFLIVDALDELDSSQRNDLVSNLLGLQAAVGVNLYFTARDLPNIRTLFDEAIVVQIKATEHDVGMYLSDQMQKTQIPNFIRNDPALQEEVRKTIINAVNDMFLLAELQVKQLMQSKTRLRLQNALKGISAGVSTYEEAYKNALVRIQSQDKLTCELALNAICLLAYAERPLLASELVHALSVDLDFNMSIGVEATQEGNLQSLSGSLGVYDRDLIPTIEDVLAASAGLVVHQPESGTVRLVHKTTKEYFTSDDGRRKWFPQAQLTIAAICLVYSQAFEIGDHAADWPFLEYAQKHYGHHIMEQQRLYKREGPSSFEEPRDEGILEPGSSFLRAQQLVDQIGLARMAQDLGDREDILILACEKNQHNLARVLLSTQKYCRPATRPRKLCEGSPFFEADCTIDRAMITAVRNSHTEIVALLLRYEASPMIQADDGTSLLAIASTEGHHEVVAYLLELGYMTMAMMQHHLDGYTRWRHRWYELQASNESSQESLSDVGDGKYDLAEGTETSDCSSESDLHDYLFLNTSAFHIPEKVGAWQVGDWSFSVTSPICRAAYYGHPLCVKRLWQWIDIETRGVDCGVERKRRKHILKGAVVCAIAEDHANVLTALLDVTGNDHVLLGILRDSYLLWWTITYSGSFRTSGGRPQDVIKFLLSEHTVFDSSIRGPKAKHACSLAADCGMAETLRLILENDIEMINSQAFAGRTALLRAAEHSQRDIIQMLICHAGIQPDLKDDGDWGPIDIALRNGNGEAVARMIPLLKDGINRLSCDGCTVLHEVIDRWPDQIKFRSSERSGHAQDLQRYEGRNIFDRRKAAWKKNNAQDEKYFEFRSYSDPHMLRRALGAVPASAAQVRSSPCRCGIGTIFLAVSTENEEVVDELLEFYPDLVNDRFYDGSSLLDLASCIVNPHTRQSMMTLILNKIPSYTTADEASSDSEDISEGSQDGNSSSDLQAPREEGQITIIEGAELSMSSNASETEQLSSSPAPATT